MRRAILRFSNLAASLGITGLFAIGYPAEGRAQTIFCPATIPGSRLPSSPVFLSNGSCTNGQDGAFSGAALASQALSELSQTTTQTNTKEIGKAIVERREQERERMRRPVRPAREVPREKPKPAEVVRKEPPPPPALLPIEPAVRFGTWTQVFGDYQKRDAAGPGILTCCGGNPPIPFGGNQPNLALNIDSRTSTVGFVAGADLTTQGLFSGFIAGVTAGYTWSEMKLNTSATAIETAGVPAGAVGTGVSHLRATVSGPTVGAYATYFSEGFSTDVTAKFDFLTVNETFNDLLATTTHDTGPPPAFVAFSGAGSVNLLNSTVVGNLNYRFDLYPNFWMEPTVGIAYTHSSYGSGAAQLGLADGNLVRLQGGARFGTSILLSNGVLMTPILTGLAYNDVVVQGGVLPGFALQPSGAGSVNPLLEGNNLLAQSDQGFMRGEGIFALNFDFGYGMSSFVLGDVYGGAHLFGAGGRAGIRYQW
jgi:Autotransporter beta-domain